jgi:hypothetical protein
MREYHRIARLQQSMRKGLMALAEGDIPAYELIQLTTHKIAAGRGARTHEPPLSLAVQQAAYERAVKDFPSLPIRPFVGTCQK